jgi:hypothetical protein
MSDLTERYRKVAKEFAEANAAASIMEESKSLCLAERMNMLGDDLPMSKREMMVKASPEWRDYIKSMVDLRTQANLKKAELEWIKMRFQEMMSEQATLRAETRL